MIIQGIGKSNGKRPPYGPVQFIQMPLGAISDLSHRGAIILIIIRRRGRRELSLGPIIEPGPY